MKPLLLIQILPLSQSKPLFSDTKEENEKGGLCVTQAHLNFISTQMCICNPRQSSKTDPGSAAQGWGLGFPGPHLGVCRAQTWDLHGSYLGSQDVWQCCAQVASFLHWQCTFSVAPCALQPTCALAVFFQIASSPLSLTSVVFKNPCLFLGGCSVQNSYSSFHFFSGREQLGELGAGMFNLDKRRLRGFISLQLPERRL